jgi:inositol 1,4,5-triphosphate receptor type 3
MVGVADDTVEGGFTDGAWDGAPECALACYHEELNMGQANDYEPCPRLQNQGYLPVWESVHESQSMLTALGALNIAQISLACFTLLLFLVVRAPVTYSVEYDSEVQQRARFPAVISFFAVWTKSLTGYYVAYVVIALLGLKYPIANSLLLYDILIKNPTSRDVLMAVVIPIKQLMATVVLGVFTIYFFALVIYENFQGDLPLASLEAGYTRRRCETLLACFQFTLGEGLRNGGGVGDVLLGDKMGPRFIVDFVFFLLVIIILLNIIFGIIIDTFSELREEKKERQLDITEKCFICNIDKSVFDMVGNGVFTRHIEEEHSMWAYLSFMVFLRNQDKDDDDGIEQYVRQSMESSDIGWFPVNKAMSLEKSNEDDDTLEAVATMGNKMDSVAAAVAAMAAKFDGVTTAVAACSNRLSSLEELARGSAVGGASPPPTH